MGSPSGPPRLASVLLWMALATVLFVGFGFAAGRAVALTAVQLGVVQPGAAGTVAGVSRIIGGLCLVGLARVYRRVAGEENAGSLAAWLAGWTVCLYAASSLLARISGVLAAVALIAVLVGWGGWTWGRRAGRGRAG